MPSINDNALLSLSIPIACLRPEKLLENFSISRLEMSSNSEYQNVAYQIELFNHFHRFKNAGHEKIVIVYDKTYPLSHFQVSHMKTRVPFQRHFVQDLPL